jgi:predicted  nucleic acid-binding Zn-ribbon protein
MSLDISAADDEIEVAQKAEADLRRAIVEIDGHAKRATQNHEAEKAKLQAALDRANGERARLAYELAKMKQQAERTMVAEQVEDASAPSTPNAPGVEKGLFYISRSSSPMT